MGSFSNGAQRRPVPPRGRIVSPYFIEHVTIYPGRYRVRTSLWSFQWDKGRCCPRAAPRRRGSRSCSSPATAAAASIRATCSATSTRRRSSRRSTSSTTWLNHNEIIGFNAASLAPVANYCAQGPRDGLHRAGHRVRLARHRRAAPRRLAAARPSAAVRRSAARGVQAGGASRRPPADAQADPADRRGQESARSRRRASGPCRASSRSPTPIACSPRSCRRRFAVRSPTTCASEYVAQVEERLKAGDCFETAMRWAYRAALCSPDFLYHVEPPGQLDDYALACRLSYFLWNSMPDDALTQLAAAANLHEPEVLRERSRAPAQGPEVAALRRRLPRPVAEAARRSPRTIPTRSSIPSSAPICRTRWSPRRAPISAS